MTNLARRLTTYKHIIWDWNGTLIDDVDLAVKSIGRVLEEFGLAPITRERYREIFGFPISKYYLSLGFDLKEHSLDKLSAIFHQHYNHLLVGHSRLFSDVEDSLRELKGQSKQSILSAGAQWHLDEWVRLFEVSHYFDHVFGIDNHNATSKLQRGRELIAVSGVPVEQTILVGDTDHDLEVGRELGVEVLLVANGHQTFQRLSAAHSQVVECRFNSAQRSQSS